MEFNKFQEQVFLVTTLVENLSDGEIGTGFLIHKPVTEGKAKQLLFSNKHVFFGRKDKDNPEAKKQIKVTLHKREANGDYVLGTILHFILNLDRKQEGYYDHPDSSVDVGCANISSIMEQGLDLNTRSVSIDGFLGINRKDLFSGQPICFVGYPTGFYDKKNFLPVMRAGIIASIPSVDFNGARQMLVDAQIFPGSSGSPVFVRVQGKYKLIGIISDGVRQGLDFVEQDVVGSTQVDKIPVPIEWIGLGLLHTYETIRELYDEA